jgi:hypothetical protein
MSFNRRTRPTSHPTATMRSVRGSMQCTTPIFLVTSASVVHTSLLVASRQMDTILQILYSAITDNGTAERANNYALVGEQVDSPQLPQNDLVHR